MIYNIKYLFFLRDSISLKSLTFENYKKGIFQLFLESKNN